MLRLHDFLFRKGSNDFGGGLLKIYIYKKRLMTLGYKKQDKHNEQGDRFPSFNVKLSNYC